ncbi:hypothetical protein LTR65_008890 [Meristemomyces frigidus]
MTHRLSYEGTNVTHKAEDHVPSEGQGQAHGNNIVINPLISSRLPWLLGGAMKLPYPGSKAVSGSKKHPSVTRPEASWRSLLLSQPPLSEVVIDDGFAKHWHRIVDRAHTAGVLLEDMDRRPRSFGGTNIRQVMGLGKGIIAPLSPFESSVITASEMLDEMACKSESNYKEKVA